MAMPGHKRCTKCGEAKPLEEFYVQRGSPRADCKVCARSAVRAHRAANKKEISARRSARRAAKSDRNVAVAQYKYGISHDEMIKRFGPECMICGKVWDGKTGKRHAIDHDHSCCPGNNGKTCGNCVRGLLCTRCNTALGLLNDDPALLDAAVAYLKAPRGATRS